MIRFVGAMLWRESRAALPRLLVFMTCIMIGVAGLVAVKNFGLTLQRTIHREARTLMASDLVLRSNRPFTPAEEAALERLRSQGAQTTASLEFVTMAQGPARGQVRLVEARAVGPAYPFYGEVVTASGRPLRELLRDDTALVESSLLHYLDLKVGDPLRLGARTFTIAGELLKEPDGTVRMLTLGPRVLLTEAGGHATGLIGPTSRVRYKALVKTPPGTDPAALARALEAELPEGFARIQTYDEAQPRVQRFLGQLTRYLNLAGLIALLLGGVTVFGVVRVFITQKIDTLAVLKCLGATSNQILAIYLVQALALGLLGSLVGAALGMSVQGLLSWLLAGFLPVQLGFAVSWLAVGEGVLLGTLTTFAFALPPLLELRHVPPSRVFRRLVDAEQRPGRRWPARAVTAVLALALVGGLAWWEAGHFRVAAIFFAGLVGTGLALFGAARGLLAVLRRLPKPRSFAWKQGLAGLYRPGNQTATVVVSLGLGALLVLVIFLLQTSLVQQVGANARADQPNLFFIDVQPGQQATFRRIVTGFGLPEPELIPVVRARLRALQGERLRLQELKQDHRRRVLGFEYALTYRAELEPGERILAGSFGAPAPDGVGVSAAEWWVDEVGLGLGDTVTFDVQGVPVTATITSIRKIDWGNRRANFSFVFPPGPLDAAPQMFAAGVRLESSDRRVALQKAVVAALPNVTALDAEFMLSLIQQILDRIALVIQFMAAFTIAAGIVILVGAIGITKYQRIREAVLLKTLGATRLVVARVLATEYLILGTLAGLVGAVAAGAVSWGLVTFVFNGLWRLEPAPYLVLWGTAAALVLLTGLASSTDVLLKKPLEVLREE